MFQKNGPHVSGIRCRSTSREIDKSGAKSVSTKSGFGSGRVVEDDAQRKTPATPQPADAVPHSRPVDAARAGDRAMVDREDDRVAVAKRHHLALRLHPRALLDEHEFAAGKVA